MKILIPFVLVTYSLFAESAIINGVKVSSQEEKEFKSFNATGKIVVNADLETIKNEILKFNNRCNQDNKKRRQFTEKSYKCPYHNPSLVESVIIKDIKNKDLEKETVDRFLVWRNVYNRNAYSYYDLVEVKNKSDGVDIEYSMLPDTEVSKYLNEFTKKETAFDQSSGVFEIRKLKNGQYTLVLKYYSKTNHWLLSSKMAESTIYEKVAKGVSLAIESVKKASEAKKK